MPAEEPPGAGHSGPPEGFRFWLQKNFLSKGPEPSDSVHRPGAAAGAGVAGTDVVVVVFDAPASTSSDSSTAHVHSLLDRPLRLGDAINDSRVGFISN